MIAKYDLIVKKLFDAILSLDRKQQMQVLSYVEGLIIENKREYARKQCDIPVTYAAINRIYSDNITNISKNGIFIETNRSLQIGETIPLSFNMQGYDRPFKIRGIVVRSNLSGVGVEFKEIRPYIAQMLGSLVERIKK